MKLSENVMMAVKNLQSNKMRSFLTMLGVIIGVGAVITMVSLGEGAKKQITDRIKQMGSNLLIISPGHGGRGGSFGRTNSLTMDLVDKIKNSTSFISGIAPEARSGRLVRAGANSIETSIIGCTPAYQWVRNYKVDIGRFFTGEELRDNRRLAVIGTEIAEELFPGVNPIGREIKIDRVRMEIIGVLAEKGQSGFGSGDDVVLVPITTAMHRVSGSNYLSSISIQVEREDYMDYVSRQINALLMAELKDEEKFEVNNMAEMLSAVQDMTRTFTMLLAGIAAVSLLVGGIGIMNIMLVSVTERIREIGVRKAVGAQKEEILAMFLIEAVVLSLTGGILGITLGWILATVLSLLLQWTTVITLFPVFVAFVFSLAVGLFFGVYPAYKAGELNPIEALRHE
ncbi:MAG: ABC transporter permease [Bacillota bacterium]